MALFEITRYLGDDEGEAKKPEATSILDQLKQQAHDRKIKLGKTSKVKHEKISGVKVDSVTESETNVSLQEADEEQSSKKKKKKKKRKLSDTDSEIKPEDDLTDVVKETDTDELTSDVKKAKLEVEATEGVDDVDSAEVKTADSKNEIGGFTVIGKVRPTKVVKVHRVLPDWLSNPTVISADLTTDKIPITEMSGLAEDLINKLRENDITHLFPVQRQVIPALLESSLTGFLTGRAGYRPSDVCVSAPTGSGKTLAFVLPIVQALRTRVTCEIRALVVLPVKDLATQVFKVFQTYCKGTNLKVGLLTGQKTFSTEQHSVVKKRLVGYHSMYDIIVATPGRLVDHINQTEGFNLGHLRYLVIDEADRMMDEVKQDWLIQVESAVFAHRTKPAPLTANTCMSMERPLQKLLYSATLSQNPEKLQQLNLFQPKLFTSVVKQNRVVIKPEIKPSPVKDSDKLDVDSDIVTTQDSDSERKIDKSDDEDGEDITNEPEKQSDDFVGKYATPTSLSEYYIETNTSQKPLIILHMLHNLKFRNIICFTNSVDTTHRLYMLIKLYGGVEVKELSSSIHVARRTDILKKFISGKIDILVCSDAMARGMDINNVNYVISYDPPPYIQTYIHRIGRTARAGKQGTAFTLLQRKEFFHFKKMVKDAGKGKLKPLPITKADLKPLVPKYEEILKQLGDLMKHDKTKKRYTAKKVNKTEIQSNTG